MGETGNNISEGEDENNESFYALTAKSYWDQTGITMIYNKYKNIVSGSEKLNNVNYDEKAKGVFVQDPGRPSVYFYFNRDVMGDLYYTIVDFAAQGLSQNPATPWGELDPDPDSVNVPCTQVSGCGRHMAVVEDKENLVAYLYFTTHFDDKSTLRRYRIANGKVEPFVEQCATYQSYDENGDGEIQIAPDGRSIAVYNHTLRQGWFDHREAQVIVFPTGGDFIVNANANTLDILYGNGKKGSLDFSKSSGNVFYNQHTMVKYDVQNVTDNKFLFQYNTLAPVSPLNPYKLSVLVYPGDVRRMKDLFTTANNEAISLSTTLQRQYGWSYKVYFEEMVLNNVQLINNSSALTDILATGYLPTQTHRVLKSTAPAEATYYRNAGKKSYELKDHLGNVRATFTDRKIHAPSIASLRAELTTVSNYYAGGMLQPGRSFNAADYRFGFNGQEKTDEISGVGNHNTALFWEYDTRLGRRWNLDPKPNPSISNYACFNGNPIWFNDVNGDTAIYFLNTQPEVAQGNGHMGMAFQNVYSEWFYFSQGAAGDAGSSVIAGGNTTGGVDIRQIQIPEAKTTTDASGHTTTTTVMRNPTAAEVDRIVRSGEYGYTYQESTQLNTNKNQDAKIARNAFKLQRDYRTGKDKYNLYFNNCTDACQGASQNNNTGVNLPIDFDPRPKEYFPKLKEYSKWFNLPASEKEKQAEQMNNEMKQDIPKF